MPGNDAYTKSLLHMNGTDGSTVFTDNAAGGSHTWTANGNAQIDTAQSKFGGASGLFDGVGDWIDTPDSNDYAMGSGDFTVDFWVRRNRSSTLEFLDGQGNTAGANASIGWHFRFNANNTVSIFAFYGDNYVVATSTITITDTNWHHIAGVRYGTGTGNLKLYIDGTNAGTANLGSNALNDSSNKLAIGRLGEYDAAYFQGWIDEYRVSREIARWTADFTPPTAEYSQDLTKSLSDSVSLSETIANQSGLSKSDDIYLSDGIIKAPQLSKSDSMILSDAQIKSFYSNLADLISLTDDLAKTFGLSSSDTITLLDFFSAIISGTQFTKDLSDDIYLSDGIIKAPRLSKADTISLLDQMVKSFGLNEQDSIALSDILSKVISIAESDSVGLNDLLSKSPHLVLSDSLTLVDVLTALKKEILNLKYQMLKLESPQPLPEGGFSYERSSLRTPDHGPEGSFVYQKLHLKKVTEEQS